MAYLLKPNENRLGMADLPPQKATDIVMVPPQPTSLNYGDRPNTMLYGTAPYMAGKGPPNVNGVLIEDTLRPQSTTRFNRSYVDNNAMQYFPSYDMSCSLPQRYVTNDPISTTAMIQNIYFKQGFCK